MRLKWKAIMGIVESIMVFSSIIFKFVTHDNPKGSTRAKPHYIHLNSEWLKAEGIFISMHTLIKGRFFTLHSLSSDSSRPHNFSVYSSQLDFHFCILSHSLSLMLLSSCYLNSCRTWFNLKKYAFQWQQDICAYFARFPRLLLLLSLKYLYKLLWLLIKITQNQ